MKLRPCLDGTSFRRKPNAFVPVQHFVDMTTVMKPEPANVVDWALEGNFRNLQPSSLLCKLAEQST